MKPIIILLIFIFTNTLLAEKEDLSKKKIETVKEDLKIIKEKIILYTLVNGFYPKSLLDLKIEKKDPWGTSYQYKQNKKIFSKFNLCSFGPDKTKSKDDIYLIGHEK